MQFTAVIDIKFVMLMKIWRKYYIYIRQARNRTVFHFILNSKDHATQQIKKK